MALIGSPRSVPRVAAAAVATALFLTGAHLEFQPAPMGAAQEMLQPKQTHTYWLEIATHAPGNFGSQWRTLTVARNTGSANATATFVLHTDEGEHELVRTIPAAAQGVFDDIIGTMGVEDKGSLEIRSSQPLNVVGRIYNQAQYGTFGQFLDGYTAGSGLSQGESAWLLGLRQEEGVFRTNLSVTNTGTTQATVRITLYGTDGTQLTEYTLSPGPSEVIQDSSPFDRRAGEPSLGWGFAEVTVTSGGGILTSASVIDSRTNDATTIPMKRPSACERTGQGDSKWLEIAVHAPGSFGSQWRTMVAARNRGESTAVVALVLHTDEGDYEITRTVPAGAQGVFDDVIGTMGVVGKGSLEVRSSQSLDVVGRIYSQAQEGTFGQLMDGYAAGGGLSKGESAWLLGLRQEQGFFRTNLSVTNTGTKDATVEVTLYATDGTQLTQYTLNPAPSEVIQDSEPFDRRGGQPNLGYGFAKVELTSGDGVLTSASVVDSRTNDATTIAMKRTAAPAVGCAPEFGGLTMLAATGEGELTAAWLPAVDDATPSSEMLYHVYLDSNPAFEPSPGNMAATIQGGTQIVLQGLEAATEYHVLVVGEDGDGLLSTGGEPWTTSALEFAPVMKPGAVLEKAEDLGLGEAAVSGSNLVFQKGTSPVLPTVDAQLIGPLAAGGGYLRTVEGVTETTTEIIVETNQASLEDAFDQFQLISAGSVPDVEGTAKALSERRGTGDRVMPPNLHVSHQTGKDGSRTGRASWGDRLLRIETVHHAGSSDGLEYRPGLGSGEVIATIKEKDLGEVTLRANLDFRPELVTEADWTLLGLVYAEVIARGTLTLDALARYEWSAAGEFERTIPIFTTSWVAVYSVGPVPVYQKITLAVEAEMTAEASAGITAEAAANASSVVEVGARYDEENGWQSVSSFDFSKSLSADLSVLGGVEGAVRIVPRLEVEFYEAAAAWISVEPTLGGEIAAEYTAMPTCAPLQLTGFDFDLDLEANVGIELTMLWRYPLFEMPIWDPEPWSLFSLPEASLSANGTGPVELTAQVIDGASNSFEPTSALWSVSPAGAAITPDAEVPLIASLDCSTTGSYTVTFSGHGVLGPLGRRCSQLEVSCSTGGGGLEEGLMAYYPFNGNADDQSGNGNDGTVTGAALCEDRFGAPYSAYDFDGVDDYIDLGLDVAPGFPLTVAAWILIDTSDKRHLVVNLDDHPDWYYGMWLQVGLYPDPDNPVMVSFGDGTGAGSESRNTKFGDSNIPVGTWVHVAGVIRGAGDMSVFVNGLDNGGYYSGTASEMAHSGGSSYLGRHKVHMGHEMDGRIDDVRIYSRALSEEEILELYDYEREP